MSVPEADVEVWQGNNKPVIWRFLVVATPFDLTGSRFLLKIKRNGRAVLSKDTNNADGLSVDAAAGEVTWLPTLAESRLVTLGRIARYELERRIGSEQRTFVAGYAVGKGGVNDD